MIGLGHSDASQSLTRAVQTHVGDTPPQLFVVMPNNTLMLLEYDYQVEELDRYALICIAEPQC